MSAPKYVGRHRKPSRLDRLKARLRARRTVPLVYAPESRYGVLRADDRSWPCRKFVGSLAGFILLLAVVSLIGLSGAVKVVPDPVGTVTLVSSNATYGPATGGWCR